MNKIQIPREIRIEYRCPANDRPPRIKVVTTTFTTYIRTTSYKTGGRKNKQNCTLYFGDD